MAWLNLFLLLSFLSISLCDRFKCVTHFSAHFVQLQPAMVSCERSACYNISIGGVITFSGCDGMGPMASQSQFPSFCMDKSNECFTAEKTPLGDANVCCCDGRTDSKCNQSAQPSISAPNTVAMSILSFWCAWILS